VGKKYWAVVLLSRVCGILSFVALLAASAQFVFAVLVSLAFAVVPTTAPDIAQFLGVTTFIGNMIGTAVTLLIALGLMAYAQMLQMMLEVTENSRFLRKLGKKGEQPPTGARFLDAPWMRKTY
jgi:hypothetical protein